MNFTSLTIARQLKKQQGILEVFTAREEISSTGGETLRSTVKACQATNNCLVSMMSNGSEKGIPIKEASSYSTTGLGGQVHTQR